MAGQEQGVSRVFDAEKNAAMFCQCIYMNDDAMTIMIISFDIFVSSLAASPLDDR
jgi:hypothetical protein